MDKNRKYNRNLFISIAEKEKGFKEKISRDLGNRMKEENEKLSERSRCQQIDKLTNRKCRR